MTIWLQLRWYDCHCSLSARSSPLFANRIQHQVLFILYSIFVTASAVNGLGSHLSELTIEQFAKAVKLEIIGQSCNIVAIATSKSSVAVFLMRILVNKWHFAFLWFCIASTVFVCISCIILMFTQCSPVEGIFNPTIPKVCYLNFTADAIFSGSK